MDKEWKKKAIHLLRSYRLREAALKTIPERIKMLELENSDAKIASYGIFSAHRLFVDADEAFVRNVAEREELQRNYELVRLETETVDIALSTLSEWERIILEKFYIDRREGYLSSVCTWLGVERSAAYEAKNAALRKFAAACFGV